MFVSQLLFKHRDNHYMNELVIFEMKMSRFEHYHNSLDYYDNFGICIKIKSYEVELFGYHTSCNPIQYMIDSIGNYLRPDQFEYMIDRFYADLKLKLKLLYVSDLGDLLHAG